MSAGAKVLIRELVGWPIACFPSFFFFEGGRESHLLMTKEPHNSKSANSSIYLLVGIFTVRANYFIFCCKK